MRAFANDERIDSLLNSVMYDLGMFSRKRALLQYQQAINARNGNQVRQRIEIDANRNALGQLNVKVVAITCWQTFEHCVLVSHQPFRQREVCCNNSVQVVALARSNVVCETTNGTSLELFTLTIAVSSADKHVCCRVMFSQSNVLGFQFFVTVIAVHIYSPLNVSTVNHHPRNVSTKTPHWAGLW